MYLIEKVDLVVCQVMSSQHQVIHIIIPIYHIYLTYFN